MKINASLLVNTIIIIKIAENNESVGLNDTATESVIMSGIAANLSLIHI